MINLIAASIVLVILGAAITYMVKAKKRGVKCIGCPDGESCSKHHRPSCSGCNAGCHDDVK